MGNICCQTQAAPSPFQAELQKPQYTYYSAQALPTNDNTLNQWLSQHHIQKLQNSQDPNFKTMKHSLKDKFYQGSWKNNVPEGKGFIYQPNKLLLSGNFINGVPEGDSVINFIQQGCQYVGQIKDGKANGNGSITSLRDKFQFTGKWENSRPQNGILTFTADPNISSIEIQDFQKGIVKINYQDSRVYQGEINTNKLLPNGKGKVTFGYKSNKTSYDGFWHNGFMHGQGVFLWMDGSKYQGQFINGKKQGQGTFYFPNGNYYRGYWVGGKQQGTGILFNKYNQELKKGIWKNGIFQAPLVQQKWEQQSKLNAENHSQIVSKIQDQIKKQKQLQKLQKSGIKERLSQLKNEPKEKVEEHIQKTPSKIIQEINNSNPQPPKSVVIQVKDTKQNPQYSSNLLNPNQNLFNSDLKIVQNQGPQNSLQSGLNTNVNNPPSSVQHASFVLDKNQNNNVDPRAFHSVGPGVNYTGNTLTPPINQLGNTGSWHKERNYPGI